MFNKKLVVIGVLVSQMTLAMQNAGSGPGGAPRGPGIGALFGLAGAAARLFGKGGDEPNRPKRTHQEALDEVANEARRLLAALRAILAQMQAATPAQLPGLLPQAQAAHDAYFQYVNGYGVTADQPGSLAATALLVQANALVNALPPAVVVPVVAAAVPVVVPAPVVVDTTPVRGSTGRRSGGPRLERTALEVRVDALPAGQAGNGRAILRRLRSGELTEQQAADEIAALEAGTLRSPTPDFGKED